VGVTFVGSDEFNNSGAARSGPIFWVTNHTSKGLCVRPWTVEIREGTNWTKWDYHGPPVFIGPHAAAYETIDFSSQQFQWPTNTWRLTVSVAEKLAGVPAFLAKIRHYPGWLRQRSNFFSMPNPFTKGAVWYGNPRKVLSEDVPQH